MKKIDFQNGVDFEELSEAGIEFVCADDMKYLISDKDLEQLKKEFPIAYNDICFIEDVE